MLTYQVIRINKGEKLNLLEILKTCESNVSQIARDAQLERQAVYLWKDGRVPREVVFKRLLLMDKYKAVLAKMNYKALRDSVPLGRKVGSVKKPG
jgi:hypothetical protein